MDPPHFIRDGAFPPTRWSLVVDLADADDGRRGDALAALCETYWFPAYAFVRRSGKPPEDAADLTQGFFADLLARDGFAQATPDRGRLRSFLLTALKRSLAKQHRHQTALKRGGPTPPLPIDTAEAEARLIETAGTPDLAFERAWARALFARAMGRLEAHFVAKGKPATFAALKPMLSGDREPGAMARAADALGISENAAGVAAHRMRKRFRDLVESEIRDTLADGEHFDDELRHLFAIFQSG